MSIEEFNEEEYNCNNNKTRLENFPSSHKDNNLN